jgi:hypothetical protein
MGGGDLSCGQRASDGRRDDRIRTCDTRPENYVCMPNSSTDFRTGWVAHPGRSYVASAGLIGEQSPRLELDMNTHLDLGGEETQAYA